MATFQSKKRERGKTTIKIFQLLDMIQEEQKLLAKEKIKMPGSREIHRHNCIPFQERNSDF